MVKTKDEILESIKAKIGESTEDSDLELLENISDTLNDFENKTKDATDWEAKYNENDKQWRQKYKDRFFSDNSDDNETFEEKPKEEPNQKTYENLFKN